MNQMHLCVWPTNCFRFKLKDREDVELKTLSIKENLNKTMTLLYRFHFGYLSSFGVFII